MDLISVIVPVYKVEAFLPRCVDSILAQTYPHLEIILVDDGSPDRCGAICDTYAARDARVRVVHKKNGGLSSARNAGLSVAVGTYVGFVDSDDYLAPQMYEKLLEALQATQSQISICSYAYVDEATGAVDAAMARINPLRSEVLSSRQALEKITADQPGYSFYVTAWNKLYVRELFDGCLFPEGKIHEDELTVHHLFDRAERIAVIDDVLYYYVQRSGSIMNTKATVKSLDSIMAMMDRYSFYRSKDRRDLAARQLRAAMWSAIDLLGRLDRTTDRTAVTAAIKPLSQTMIRTGDARVLRLLNAWLGYVRRCR